MRPAPPPPTLLVTLVPLTLSLCLIRQLVLSLVLINTTKLQIESAFPALLTALNALIPLVCSAPKATSKTQVEIVSLNAQMAPMEIKALGPVTYVM